jgi:hypothetical protein
MTISAKDFGVSFKGFLDQISAEAPAEEPVFRRRLMEHFGCDPKELPALSEKFHAYEHANVHMALEAEFSGGDCKVTTYGVMSPQPYLNPTISMLAAPAKAGFMGGEGPVEGPVEYANITLDDDRVIACVQSGLFLVKRSAGPLAVLMSGPAREFHPMAQVVVQVMAPSRGEAEGFLATLRNAMRKRNVFRGHVLSMAETRMGSVEIKFHRLPTVHRENIILPDGLLDASSARQSDSPSFQTRVLRPDDT